jgi:hypothetical protein
MYTVSLRRVHATILAAEKAKSMTYSKSVFVALGIQHAMRMHHIFDMACPAHCVLPHELKRHDFRANVIEYKMCVWIFSTSLV